MTRLLLALLIALAAAGCHVDVDGGRIAQCQRACNANGGISSIDNLVVIWCICANGVKVDPGDVAPIDIGRCPEAQP